LEKLDEAEIIRKFTKGVFHSTTNHNLNIMKIRNKNSYSEEDRKIARFARALGHPARIAILRYIASLNTCCFNEISKEMPLADSTVSQHLSELKSAGLIQGSFEPPKVMYSINNKNWKLLRKYFKEFTKIKMPREETKNKKSGQ
jgi:DNA-binding transcriptional ArsR family regulator